MGGRAFVIGTKKYFNALPKVYKSMFSRDYLGSAGVEAQRRRASEARVIAERVLLAAGFTIGSPVMLPVSMVRGIYKNTKEEIDRRKAAARGGGSVAVAPIIPSPPQTPLPVGPRDHAANILYVNGLSKEAAEKIADCIFKPEPDWPQLDDADQMRFLRIVEHRGEAAILGVE